jgi:hypothetical protein
MSAWRLLDKVLRHSNQALDITLDLVQSLLTNKDGPMDSLRRVKIALDHPSIAPPAQIAMAWQIYDYFRAPGRMKDFQSCGMVAQARGESNFVAHIMGDNGHAYGMFQLHADRAKLICDGGLGYKGCGIDVTTLPPADKQLEAVWWELQHSEHSALKAILATANVYDAGFVACQKYERPANHIDWDKRGKFAQEWYSYFLLNKNPAK